MKIYGPAQLHGAQSVPAPHIVRGSRSSTAVDSVNTKDEVTISDAARQVDKTQSSSSADRIASIRAQIASGAYETPAKLDVAVSRLLDAIG